MGKKQSTLQQYKEATMLCEEGMSTTEARNALLIPQNIKQTILAKTQNSTRKINKHSTGKINKHYTNCG
jgi:hypothetical protein